MIRKVRILGTGKYLPDNKCLSKDLEEKFNLTRGWIKKTSGVDSRYFVDKETSSQMGALAAEQALKDSNLNIRDIDCIVSGNGVMQQAIPCTASLIQKHLKAEKTKIPCFDINSTCLSFITALDLISAMIEIGIYKKVLIISSDISSVGINWKIKENFTLFGDGAAAVVVGYSKDTQTSKIYSSKMETYSEGIDYAFIKGGGSMLHPRKYSEKTKEDFLFHMDGKKIYKLVAQNINDIVNNILHDSQLTLNNIDLIIPHQASLLSMKLIQKKLQIPDSKFLYTIQNYGNTIAASLPLALNDAISQKLIKRGDKIMLLGTSAGVSIGAIIFEY